jgi:hypothetical protein
VAYQDAHISEQDLILAADGELSGRRIAKMKSHLSNCWTCRAKMTAIEGAIADFVGVYRDSLDSRIPSSHGSRALFKARLSQLAAEHPQTTWQQLAQFGLSRRRFGYLFATFVFAFALLMLWPSSQPSLAWSPNPQLTPGVTLPLTERDLCEKRPEVKAQAVPATIGLKVFEQYGISNPQPRHYEMDYLIDPDLGGADDARNLWPQPYSALWSANVKDALEDHLRELVCSNKITLAQAQRDISVDWISAYKAYFNTDHPFAIHQAFRKDEPWE